MNPYRFWLIGMSLAACVACSVPRTDSVTTPGDEDAPVPRTPDAIVVTASVETENVQSSEDAADDPAIWVHPTDPSMSLLIGTDKTRGLAVYDLDGKQLQFLEDGELNNVDVRGGFALGGTSVDIAVAGNRTDNSMAIYAIDPESRRLTNVGADSLPLGIEVYGSCLYKDLATGKLYAFFNAKDGTVEQWELVDNGAGRVAANRVRTFDVGSQVEGCVADDELGHFYIGEEEHAIWKYSAAPDGGDTRTMVDDVRPTGHIEPDVEGLTIYQSGPGTGYLIASSQGSNEFLVYRREGDNAFLFAFSIGASETIDEVSGTDGIDVVSANLGGAFTKGLFVAQDDEDDAGTQNFKLVPWSAIAEAGLE